MGSDLKQTKHERFMTAPHWVTPPHQPIISAPCFLDRAGERGFLNTILNAMEPMTLTDVEAVTALHISEIPSGILTEMGADFLTLFYRQVVADPLARGYVIRQGNTITGFITGSIRPDIFFRHLFVRFLPRIAWIILKKGFTQPSFLPRFFQRVVANLRKEGMAESLSAAIAIAHKGKGYGVVFLKKLLDEFKRCGVTCVQCDVAEKAGDPAIDSLHQMYQKGGYQQIAVFQVGGITYRRYKRYLM